MMDVTFPTTSSTLIEVNESHYNLLQLEKHVDIAAGYPDSVDTAHQSEVGAPVGSSKQSRQRLKLLPPVDTGRAKDVVHGTGLEELSMNVGPDDEHELEEMSMNGGGTESAVDVRESTPTLNLSRPPTMAPSQAQLSPSHTAPIVSATPQPISTSGIRATIPMLDSSPSSRNDNTVTHAESSTSSSKPPTIPSTDFSMEARNVAAPRPPSAVTHTRAPQPRPSSHVHLHSHSLEISLAPPRSHIIVTRWGPNRGDNIPNPDRTRYDQVLSRARKVFSAAEPFVILPRSDGTIQVPVDSYGDAATGRRFGVSRRPGFEVLAPSKLKRQNITPLLRAIDHPSTQSSAEWFPNSTTFDTSNWIHAALSLDPKQPPVRKGKYRPERQKIYMDSELKGCWMEEEAGAENVASLRLILDIDIYFDSDTIFEPSTDISDDLTGLILHSLIPSPTTTYTVSESERRADSLRHFYACLRPAPPVPYARSLQPANLVSKLLPFQNRTVIRLAQREKAVAGHSGDPSGFWSIYEMGEFGKVAYRRLTGELVKLSDGNDGLSEKQKGKSREVPTSGGVSQPTARHKLPVLLDLSEVRGTMLCEEMGLGKTVESIALMLLNRHPLSSKRVDSISGAKAALVDVGDITGGSSQPRQAKITSVQIPTIDLSKGLELLDPQLHKWWQMEREQFKQAIIPDRITGGRVSQVAATLIVTPPSLLKQWVAEMATHAPTLRVCVYAGWKSLLDGVAKRVVTDKASHKSRLVAKRKRDNDRQRASTVRKYQKTTKGKSIKIEPEDTPDSEDEELPVEDLQQRTQRLFVDFVRAHDVVITTYPELSKDLSVALPAPPRSRRSNVNYQTGERPRSPLVMVQWWRVIMDEVQLCGDSSGAANMVSLIPRQHSLAVSGTPARTDVKDLLGSLRFLGVPEIPQDARLWHRLQQPSMRPAFDGVFQSIAIRTTKKEVAGEFELPHQTRMIIPIELSEIEMHYYNDTLERQRVILGLPADPTSPRPDDWYLQTALFRNCLKNLRQICTHIQVGQMAPGQGGRRGGRLRLGRELLTLSEALSRISQDHEAERLLTVRAQLRAMIRQAQLLSIREEKAAEGRSLETNATILGIYGRVRGFVALDLEPIRLQLDKLLEAREGSLNDIDEESEKDLTQQERDHVHELQHMRQAIRELLLILHQSWFFEGDRRHVNKEVEAEVECYAQAEATRKEILARPLRIANASVDILKHKLQGRQPIGSVADLQTGETERGGGILSDEPITQSNELLKILNENASALLVCNWRAKIVELLLKPIDSGNELVKTEEDQDITDPEKEQYAEALEAQGQVEAYLIAYAAAIADRREMMLEERTLLASHEARVKKTRTTKVAFQALADSEIPADIPDGVANLVNELMGERQALRDARKVRECERPLKGMLVYLNNITHGGARVEEIAIAQQAADFLRVYIKAQTDYVDSLNKELDMFRDLFNRRVKYFAALQEISDSVTVPTAHDVDAELLRASLEVVDHEATLARSVVRGRYLKYLASRDGTADAREDCLICMGSSDDAYGFCLDCGHFFCVSCFREFRKTPLGRKCPQCRTEIEENLATRVRIELVPDPLEASATSPAQALPSADPDAALSDPAANDVPLEEIDPSLTQTQVEQQQRQQDLERLNMMPVGDRRSIGTMDMMGDFGSKINFLVKHLLWYQVTDPSTRHVVFSNWSDSLRIVIQALQTNGIKFVSFDKGGKQGGDIVEEFQQDETIRVFLLHAERESAGLTLTSCSTVHLLEPVLRHSFELQAIGRVDRLGQKQETTVFCYATQDTVESRILSQGVRNGTSIYLNEKERGDQVVEDLDNVVSAAHKGGDIGVDGNEEEMLQLIML